MQIAPPPDNAYLQPLTSRIIEGRIITPYDYRAVAIPLYTTLDGNTLRGSASYNIPTNMRFRVRQVIPHIALLSPSADAEFPAADPTFHPGDFAPNADAIYKSGGVMDRVMAKAMNCRISLAFQSRAYEVIPNLAFPLSDLFAQSGMSPSFLDMPGEILQGTTLDLNVGLTDPNLALSATEYGVILVGAFIRVD